MKNLIIVASTFLLATWGNNNNHARAFSSLPAATTRDASSATSSRLFLSSSERDDERMRKILQEEAMSAENLRASAQEMKNMKPEQIDQMIKDMDNMPRAQLDQLKAMGMDPEMMKMTMQTMKTNPAMMESVGKMMEQMTPEQLVEQSRQAQERLRATVGTPTPAPTPTATPATVVTVNEDEDEDDEDEDDDEEDEDGEPIELDPEALDGMYRVAELMAEPPNGGVTFQAFCSLPPITVLAGEDNEDDLSVKELKDCWSKGSLGSTRLDRAGFERVWAEVQDQYYNEIIEEARERIHAKKVKKKRGSAEKPVAATVVPTTTPATTPATTPVTVGAQISPQELSKQINSLSDSDVANMFDEMTNMTPAQEARMKAMGVDPGMMKKSAEMMKNNPLARKAATMMMKNASPEQLMKASQEAQARMANMSEEEKKHFREEGL